MNDWVPPFCSRDADDLECPRCGVRAVQVMEQDLYNDGYTSTVMENG